MRIAIPTENNCLHGHFGGCREFTFAEVDQNGKVLLHSETVPAPEHKPGAFPRWLRENGIDVVIVGGIGQRALDVFARNGIVVRAGQPGTSIEDLVMGFLSGALTSAPDGCSSHGHHHHHHHGHGHDHDHGHAHNGQKESESDSF